ncbi:MAG TPA: hypothetical protein VK769_03475, partial [Verrucomicrobiae bacterium]|nr:hypothetical protein [Verrucomicrobiae bacterium]
IVVKGASCPIYFLVWDRLRTGDPGKKVGTIKNVHMQDVTITDCAGGIATQPSVISGWATSQFENIMLENVKIIYKGGGTNALADLFPPNPRDYSPRSFGPRPASAFYIRNGKGLTLKNVEFGFENSDARIPLFIDNVDGVALDNFKTQKSSAGRTIRLEHVKNFTVENSPDLKDRRSVTMANDVE